MVETHEYLKSAAEQFREAIVQKGITPPDVLERDGEIHRFSSSGRKDDDAGWYVFYDGDIATGAFGDFRSGKKVKAWKADIGRPLTDDEERDFRRKQAVIKDKRDADKAANRIKARDKANGMLRHSRPASDDHPYLARKGVKAHRVAVWKDLLVVPMIDDTQKVQSLQLISGDGGKKFLSGGKMQGCYFPIGSVKDASTILIAEGYATAATIHEATGLPVIVAYNAGNLLAVSKSIYAQHPQASLVLCADDDFRTKGNPGLTYATEAAQAVGGKVVVPTFGKNRPDGATDFNDMAAHLGKDAVAGFFTKQHLERSHSMPAQAKDDLDGECVDSFVNPFFKEEEEEDKPLRYGTAPKPQYRQPPTSSPVYPPEPRTHFPAEEFLQIHDIWKGVPCHASSHNNTGYHILLENNLKIEITKDKITMEKGLWHRPPDEAYVAACEQARQFWGGQMVVNGDSKHRIKAWAYASVYGVEVTNFKPTINEQAEADKLIEKIRHAMEPSFGRPPAARTAKGQKPSP